MIAKIEPAIEGSSTDLQDYHSPDPTQRMRMIDARNSLRVPHRWRIAAWCGAAGLVLLPLLAMRFTTEVNWGPEDFVFAIALVVGVGLVFELAVRVSNGWAYRSAAALGLAAAFLLLWGNAAVGFIGSEDNPVNGLFFAVPAVGLVGAALARGRAMGMAYAMAAAGAAQVLVAAIALAIGAGFTGPLTVFFTALWLASAWLFRRAAR